MKKQTVFLTAIVLSAAMTACAPQADAPGTLPASTDAGTFVVQPLPSAQVPDVAASPAATQETQTRAEPSAQATLPVQTAVPDTQPTPDAAPEATDTVEADYFEDNFAVSSQAAAAFAQKRQDAAANQDLEALADLAAYPLYIGFPDGGVSVAAREDWTALGADVIFTSELVDSIAGADLSTLTASRAGFSLSKDGRPNIIFGVRDGRLAISGINY